MLIEGEWRLGEDGVKRPFVLVRLQAADGGRITEWFLVDTGAERTVLTAGLLERLGLPTSASGGFALAGIGGKQTFVQVATALELVASEGPDAVIRGTFSAFTDPSASDCSILGRDVLNNFDVIVSRPRNQVLLLAAPHAYRVERP